jgi:tetratricopeptide (TPR) repeat protein
MEPIPFEIDKHVNSFNSEEPVEVSENNKSAIARALGYVADPFIKQGYVAAAALNRGAAAFSQHLDNMAGFIETSTGMKREGLFEQAAKEYADNAQYWQKRAEEKGIGFIDELMGEAVGGFVPGVTQFALDVASGLTFSYMDGAYEGYKKGENPFEKGMLEAAKTGTLHQLFRVIGPLKQYLKAPVMGTVFGTQAAMEAPEGTEAREFGKGFGTGLIYSMTSPGGEYGLNEVTKNVKPLMEDFAKRVNNQRGTVDLEPKKETKPKAKFVGMQDPLMTGNPQPVYEIVESPDPSKWKVGSTLTEMGLKEQGIEIPINEVTGTVTRQRQFLQTIEESADIDPSLKPRVAEIEPQDYFVKPNAESTEVARKAIEIDADKAFNTAMSDAPLSAEKGALFHELIKKYQKEGNFDKAIEVIEEFDKQGRSAGQFIQTAAQWSKLLSPEGFIKWANKQLEKTSKKYTWMDTILKKKPSEFKLTREEEAEVLRKYREMNDMSDIDRADATLELIDMVAKKTPPSISELIDAYRYQNMLSSPKTQMRNIGENIFNTFITKPVDITTRGSVDFVQSSLKGKEREVYLNDVPVYLKATINALPNAVNAFKETIKLGKSATLTKPELGVEAKTAFETARSKQLPTYLTLVSRFMEAADKFNMSLIGAGQMALDLKAGKTELEAYSHATAEAEKLLYRNDIDPSNPEYSIPSTILAELGKSMESMRKYPYFGKVVQWYIPFIRTPINKAIQMMERTPLGAIRKPSDWTADVASKQLGGAIVMALGATVAYMGETTWSPPTKEKEKELFYASGRKPYSIKMGDNWVPIWYLGPFALAFGIPMAIKYYTQDQKGALEKDASEKIFDISEGVAQFIGNQSSTQSIGALFSALDGDIDYKLSSQTGFALTQFVPASSLIRYVNTIVDPVYRKPNGFVEGLEANIPILSKGLDARMKPFFEESRREPINYFLPYDIGKSDETYNALYELETMQLINDNGKKLDKLTERMRKNPMSVEKTLEEYTKLILQEPKIKEQK